MVNDKMVNGVMFKITPPIWQNVVFLLLLFTCTLLLPACTCCHRSDERLVYVDNIPRLSADIFYSRDSLLFYAQRAYETEDPEALCITATSAYHLRYFDTAAADSLSPVTEEDASVMLLRACELGYEPAYIVLHYLDQLGLWSHTVPNHDYKSCCVDTASLGADYFSLEVKK